MSSDQWFVDAKDVRFSGMDPNFLDNEWTANTANNTTRPAPLDVYVEYKRKGLTINLKNVDFLEKVKNLSWHPIKFFSHSLHGSLVTTLRVANIVWPARPNGAITNNNTNTNKIQPRDIIISLPIV